MPPEGATAEPMPNADAGAVPRTGAGLDGGTLMSLLAANAASHGATAAIRERDRGIWREFTWNDVLEQVLCLAAALDGIGFKPGEGLLVIGDNRPRLYFGMLAAGALRGLPAPVYPDVPPDDLVFYAANGRARFALGEDQEQVDKLLELRSRSGLPEYIVYDDPRGLAHYKEPGLIAWDDLVRQGAERLAKEPGLRADLIGRARPTDAAVLLHSSGTTGAPKGIVLQHRRVIAAVRNAQAADYFRAGDELVAYLPMAWVGDFVFTLSSGFPRLKQRATAQAGYLSGGEQQMLAIGRALMTEPKLLMLDEPSLGLAPYLVDEIFDIISRINRETKMGILLVEQNATAALDIVDHAHLLENGRVVMGGTADTLRQNPDVQEFYLGGVGRVDYRNVKHYRRRKRWLA